MAYKDGEDFTTYCDKDYDRHIYKLKLREGKSLYLDTYEEMRAYWYHLKSLCLCVEVIDKGGKGF